MAKASSRSGKKRGARLGQHFLTGIWAAARLAEAVGVRAGETILEIGPGKGALTKELLKYGSVVAVEKDPSLVEALHTTFSGEIDAGKLRVVEEDVRNVDPETLGISNYVLAANIPYYITGEIIRQFLTAERQPRAMALLMQKEVAERIIARDGKESLLSLSVKAYGTPKIIAKVSRGNFSPPPSVDSAILLVADISRSSFASQEEEARFFEVLHAGFSAKRKFALSNLSKRFDKTQLGHTFETHDIPANVRAEDISLDAWLQIIRSLS